MMRPTKLQQSKNKQPPKISQESPAAAVYSKGCSGKRTLRLNSLYFMLRFSSALHAPGPPALPHPLP